MPAPPRGPSQTRWLQGSLIPPGMTLQGGTTPWREGATRQSLSALSASMPPQQQLGDERAHHQHRPQRCLVFAMLHVQLPRIGAAWFAGLVGREAWEKPWHVRGILIIVGKDGPQITLFRDHDRNIDREEHQHGAGSDPW